MNELRVEYLLKYLELLLKAQEEGCKSYQEISATTRALALELGLNSQRGISITDKDGKGIIFSDSGSMTCT